MRLLNSIIIADSSVLRFSGRSHLSRTAQPVVAGLVEDRTKVSLEILFACRSSKCNLAPKNKSMKHINTSSELLKPDNRESIPSPPPPTKLANSISEKKIT